MNRQRKKQLEHIAYGLCQICPKKAWLGGVYCKTHALKRGMTGERLLRRLRWQKVHWDQPDKIIAAQVGVTCNAVRWQRNVVLRWKVK